MNKVTKLFRIDLKSVDETKRQVTFVFSNDTQDRQGEIVDQASWDVKNYEKNPIILWGHDPSIPENVLGQGVSLSLNQNHESLVTAQFDDVDTNPRADRVFRQIIKRTLRTVSAGFIPHTIDTEDDIPVMRDNELIEISIVPIPANPGALALELREGSMSRKDAEFLLTSMKAEEALIEKQLSKSNMPDGMKEKDMEELNQKIDTLTSIISGLAEAQAAQTSRIDEIATLVTPVEESEEDKATREAAEQKVINDKAEEDRIAAEEAAKGGDKTNPVLDDDVDLESDDLELTDEQLAEAEELIDAELALAE